MHSVGIGEQEPAGTGMFGPGNERIVLSSPVLGQGLRRDHSHSDETLSDLARAVSGGIVDQDDFERYSGLRGQRLQTVGKATFLVPGRNDYRNLGDRDLGKLRQRGWV